MTTAAKKGGVFGFLKESLFEEVPDAAKPSSPQSEPPKAAVAPPAAAPLATPRSAPAEADPAVLNALEAKLQAACPPAYQTFMDTFESLKDDLPDEAVRFRVALKTSKTTATQITDALDILLRTMDSAEAEFDKLYKANQEKEGQASQAKLTEIATELQQIENAIAGLNARRELLRGEQEAETNRSAAKLSKHEATKQRFIASHRQVVSRLQVQKSRIPV